MVDTSSNFGKTLSKILGDMDALPMAIDPQLNVVAHGTQPVGLSDLDSMIRRIKEMEAMLKSLKREYEQNIKGSTLDTPVITPPPPPSVTSIPSRRPVRKVKSGNSKGKAKRVYFDDDESDSEQSALS